MTPCPDCNGSGAGETIHGATSMIILDEVVTDQVTYWTRCETCKGKGEVDQDAIHPMLFAFQKDDEEIEAII